MSEAILKGEAGKARHRARRPWLSPLNQRRWHNFKANRRGYWSLWIFGILFALSLVAELIDDSRLDIAFAIPERYASLVANAVADESGRRPAVRIETDSGVIRTPVVALSPRINAETHTLSIIARIEWRRGLIAGSFVDGERLSDVKLADLDVPGRRTVTVRIGVKDAARNRGGINIFGRVFGNHPQDILLNLRYSLPDAVKVERF